jgi:hypothetical protein
VPALGTRDIAHITSMLRSIKQNTVFASNEMANLIRTINVTLLSASAYSIEVNDNNGIPVRIEKEARG